MKSICCVAMAVQSPIALFSHTGACKTRMIVSSFGFESCNGGSLSGSSYTALGIILSISHALGSIAYLLITKNLGCGKLFCQ